jgi:hypothetical protein
VNTDKLTALWLDMSAARRADWDAQDLWAALKADPATTFDELARCWDRAILCTLCRAAAQRAFKNAIADRKRVAA